MPRRQPATATLEPQPELEHPVIPTIVWKCRCGAHGTCDAAHPSKRYALHRGKIKGGAQPRPGHGLVAYTIVDQTLVAELYQDGAPT